DEIEYALPFHLISSPLLSKSIRHRLSRTFHFRHRRTSLDLSHQSQFSEKIAPRVLITGASGLIGANLKAYLETAGYIVFTLSRRSPASPRAFQWDLNTDVFPIEALEMVDAVIHLSGENIAGGYWTNKRKKQILESRVRGTQLLVEAIRKSSSRPKVLISASAIGFYGDRQGAILTEVDPPDGKNSFVSEVTRAWEHEALKAEDAGVRTVLARFGIVLSPQGGALQKMLLPFQLGLGGPIGGGSQWMSWIGIDDALYALHTLLETPQAHGAYNLVAPEPVTNGEFTKILASVLSRPALFPVPEVGLKLLMGQLAEELLLSSCRVSPARLTELGYSFAMPSLEEYLRFALGRELSYK
ncbi:MAG: TIGR01777 family oxidoreductase, partial [Bdellovibrionales bacterium]|nr:TIGR01777 family oxidoreductase [Bdellovibrionales bacterium]